MYIRLCHKYIYLEFFFAIRTETPATTRAYNELSVTTDACGAENRIKQLPSVH